MKINVPNILAIIATVSFMLTVGAPLTTSTKLALVVIKYSISVAVISSVAGIFISGFYYFKSKDEPDLDSNYINSDLGSFIMCTLVALMIAVILLMAA